MLKKILSTFAISLFSFLPNLSHANIVGTVPDAVVLGIDCSSSVCITPPNIKEDTYGAPYFVCGSYFPDGTCGTLAGPEMYGNDALAVNLASINHLILIESGNPTKKTVGYQNCIIIGGTTSQCNLIISEYNAATGVWTDRDGGNIAQSYRVRSAQTCPYSGVYIWGQGCMVNGYSSGGTVYKTVRTSPVGPSTCTDGTCKTPEATQGKAQAKAIIRNPVDITSGAKFDGDTDITFPIPFSRTYSSARTNSSSLGIGWKHNFEKSLVVVYNTSVSPQVPMLLRFTLENDTEVLLSRELATDPFTPILKDQKGFSVTSSSGTYILTAPNGSKEHYDVTGKLVKMVARNGYTYNLVYSAGKLSTVTDSYGRSITLTYTGALLTKVAGSNNALSSNYIDYVYTGGLLTQAKYNNSETLNYAYTTTAPVGLLYSKTDAKAQTYAFYTYDAQKRVTQTKHQSAIGTYVSVDQYAYSNTDNSGFTVTHTLPDSSTSTYDTSNQNFTNQVSYSSISGTKNTNSMSFDSAGNVSYYDDGISSSSFTYDSTINLLTNSSAYGKTRVYTWDNTKRLINSYTESAASGNRTYAFTYDASGNVTQKTVTSGTAVRTWNYTYSTFGKMLTQTAPTGAVTTFTYYSDTDSNVNRRGLPNTITNAIGQVLTITSYDNRGNPTGMTLPNGLTKTMTYDQRGRVLTEVQSNGTVSQTNTYTYDANGQMTVAQFANGYILTMIYDMDHKFTNISDNRSNSIAYTLDTNGNPTNESEYTSSSLVSVRNKLFDGLSRMTQISRASGSYAYNYTYDKRDRVTSETNPNSVSQNYTYDSKDDVTGISGLNRDQTMYRDGDSKITSANQQGNTTSFTYNNFNEMLTLSNPDTGYHKFTYNIPTKTTTHTDNSGTVETNVYDNLGRPTSVTRVNGVTNTETYLWDTVKAGKLTSITDSSGSTVYGYNASSWLSSKTQNITTTSGTFSKAVNYTYDNAGQVTKITYPSGMEINYSYTNGVVTSVKKGTVNIATSINYKGFNSQPYKWTWGNTSATTRNLSTNTSDRLNTLVDGTVINQTYTQDNIDNVTGATDTANTSNTFTATYTNSEQLTDFTNSSITRNYLQDTKFNVNKITPFNPSTAALYYSLNNNKISNLVYGSAYKYPVFDTKGNMTTDGNGGTFTYDLANNMVTASKINSGVYKYNALHQRVEKAVTVGGTTTKTYYIYNTNGSLLGEYDASGNVIAEHVYLKNIPVAVVKGANTYFVHTDYLNTPRAISNSAGSLVWKWDNTNAYGYNSANETVSGTAFEYNPRFAGQYFDKETGLHYNLNRMYNPELARYMQPDPIGVNGGMNIYSYVENNPLNAVDPNGLFNIPFTNFDLGQDSLNENLVNGVAGFGDSISFDITKGIRFLSGIDGNVNGCNTAYQLGEGAGIGLSLTFGGVHLGRNLVNQSMSRGKQVYSQGFHRVFSDNRVWGTVRSGWSKAEGNGKAWLQSNGQSLHHWLIPQRSSLVSQGVKNAGFNYMPLTASFNSWMNGSTIPRQIVEQGFKSSVLGVYSAPAVTIVNSFCDCK